MTEQTIDVTGLPEGWKAVAYRLPINGQEYSLTEDNTPFLCTHIDYPCLIIEKIKPRRIVFETTGERRKAQRGDWIQITDEPDIKGDFNRWNPDLPSEGIYEIWRVVEDE